MHVENKSNSAPGLELIFNDRHCNTSTEINNEWAKYFAKLYTPAHAAHFDNAFSETIRTEMVNIRNDLEFFSEIESFPVLSVGKIESALKLRQRYKAGEKMVWCTNISSTVVRCCMMFYPEFLML